MIRVSVETTDLGAKRFLVDLGERLVDRGRLSRVLAERMVDELEDHFRQKNQTGNRLGGRRTNFWGKMVGATQIAEVSDSGAVVAIGGEQGQHIRIHVFGGTIKPKSARYLTIPIVREAHGLRAGEYEERRKRKLFTIPGRNALFEVTDSGATESVFGDTAGRTRSARGNSIGILVRGRSSIRPVYALAKSATIPPDPTALPPDAELTGALTEQANEYFDSMGGGAR